MATGSSDAQQAAGIGDELADRLAGEEPLSIVTTPAVRSVVAAAAIASAAPAMHVRVVGPDRPPIEMAPEPVIATASNLGDADIELSPYTPFADIEPVVADAITPAIETAMTTLRLVGTEPTPGIVTTHDDIETALERSIRLDPPADEPPITGSIAERTTDERRRLTSWLAAATVADGRPAGAATALETAIGPTVDADGPAPTAEGGADIIATVAEADPGRLVAGLLADDWADIRTAYETAHETVCDAAPDLPAGDGAEVAVASVNDTSVSAVARRWAANGLNAPYGVVFAGEAPTALALVAPGERAASAVLETVASRFDGTSWGGPFIAGAILPERPEDPARTITEAL